MLIVVLAALVVTVITLVNHIERRAGSILDNLTATGHLAATSTAAGDLKSELDAIRRS